MHLAKFVDILRTRLDLNLSHTEAFRRPAYPQQMDFNSCGVHAVQGMIHLIWRASEGSSLTHKSMY